MLLRPEALFWLQEWGSPHCAWLTVTDRLPHSISLLCFNHYFPQVFFLDLKFFFHMNCWNLRLYLGAQFWFIILILEPLLWKRHSQSFHPGPPFAARSLFLIRNSKKKNMVCLSRWCFLVPLQTLLNSTFPDPLPKLNGICPSTKMLWRFVLLCISLRLTSWLGVIGGQWACIWPLYVKWKLIISHHVCL